MVLIFRAKMSVFVIAKAERLVYGIKPAAPGGDGSKGSTQDGHHREASLRPGRVWKFPCSSRIT